MSDAMEQYIRNAWKLGILDDELITHLTDVLFHPDMSYDQVALSKAAVLSAAGLDMERIIIILRDCLNSHKEFNVEKFWHIVAPFADKFGIDLSNMKDEIQAYQKMRQSQREEIVPISYAVEKFLAVRLSKELIAEIFRIIVDNQTAPGEDWQTTKRVVDEIVDLVENNFPKSELIPLLKNMVDGQMGLPLDKFDAAVAKPHESTDGRKIGRDGDIKIKINTWFLNRTGQMLNIMRRHEQDIRNIIVSSGDDIFSFARKFYELYVGAKGYADIAPELELIPLPEDSEQRNLGYWNNEGQIALYIRPNFPRVDVVAILVHELTHFEQWLDILRAEELGLDHFAKRHAMSTFLHLVGGAEKVLEGKENEKQASAEFSDEVMSKPLYKYGLQKCRKRFEDNPFIQRAMQSKWVKPILKTDARWADVASIADDDFLLRNPNDLWTYRNYRSEMEAHSVGNAALTAFDKILKHMEKDGGKQFSQPSRAREM